tara:strand:+ start:24887 stop:25957 length:1071 start_codon:yes stop_codon:yes gene_type:complete
MKNFSYSLIGLFIILLTTKAYAQVNPELDIIGNWVVENSEGFVNVPFPQEDLENLIMMVEMGFITAEDFMIEMGFPMPTTQEEWDDIADNGLTIPIPLEDEIDISGFAFSSGNLMTLFAASEGSISLFYEWSSDSSVIINSATVEDFPFQEFTIASVNSETLVMTTSLMIDEDETIYFYDIVFTCSSTDIFIPGCNNPVALNYNTEANINNGSCLYPYPCDSNELLLTLNDDASDGWEGSELIINGISYTFMDGEEKEFCIENASCFSFATLEGEYMDEASWEISNENGDLIYQGGLPFSSVDIEDPCLEIKDILESPSRLLKVFDLFGREQSSETKGIILFYEYENGNVIKKINL